MNSLRSKNIAQLKALIESLSSLSDKEYSQKIEALSQVSLGQHFRHIIEFYQILKNSVDNKMINYENRQRQESLEKNLSKANIATIEIVNWLETELKDADLYVNQINTESSLKTSFKRELQYVYEHTTHHMAIIKIGIQILQPSVKVDNSYGVADSTLSYRAEH